MQRLIAVLAVIGLVVSASQRTLAQEPEIPLWQMGIATFPGKAPATEGATLSGSVQAPPTDVPTTAVPSSEVATVSANLPVPIPESMMDLPLVDPGNLVADGPASELPIGSAIESGQTAEEMPLAEESMSWYQVPWQWVTQGWVNHAEFGLDGSSGNSKTLALQTGLEMKRKTDQYTLALDFDYRKATNRGVTTEDNGRYNLDYDRMFKSSRWSAFGKFGAEWDQFKAFDLRLNMNGGVGYYFLRSDSATFATRFGAGASKEFGAPDDDWKPEAVFGTEGEFQVNKRNKIKGKLEYFPAWEDFSDYRLVADAAWEILLDEAENLSLKLAVTDRYDSTPQGARPNDVYYSMLLLIKF